MVAFDVAKLGVDALYRVIFVAALLSLTLGCTSMNEPLQTVAHVDLPRYMGDWYVIANIPYFAEKNCYSIESYAVGHPSRRYGWIMARKQSLDDEIYRRLLDGLVRQGYDPAKFQKVPQRQSSGAALPVGASTSH